MDVVFADKHYPGMESELQNRVAERMRQLGLKASPLAKKAGLGESFVRDILRGKTSVPKADNLERLARALDTTSDFLLGTQAVAGAVPIPRGHLSYGGTVAAGDWLSADDFNQDMADHAVPDSVPRHPAYPHLQQIAWRVEGTSMDQAGILDGMWLVGASYADYVDKIGELDNGNYVVVERARYQAQERELTVKEVQFARKGMRLIPRSSDSRHREFFIDLDEEADPDTETVRILGVVLWFGKDVDPRSRRSRPMEVGR